MKLHSSEGVTGLFVGALVRDPALPFHPFFYILLADKEMEKARAGVVYIFFAELRATKEKTF